MSQRPTKQPTLYAAKFATLGATVRKPFDSAICAAFYATVAGAIRTTVKPAVKPT